MSKEQFLIDLATEINGRYIKCATIDYIGTCIKTNGSLNPSADNKIKEFRSKIINTGMLEVGDVGDVEMLDLNRVNDENKKYETEKLKKEEDRINFKFDDE